MSQVNSAVSSAACGSRGRKKSRKRKHRNRSTSTISSRGPYNVADSVLQKPPWYEAAEFTRFWSHYSALMFTTHASVLRHAAAADVCPCELRAQRNRNKREKRHKGCGSAPGAPYPEDKWRPLSPTPNPLSPRLCHQHKQLLSSPSRRCGRARRRSNVAGRYETAKKKAPLAGSKQKGNCGPSVRDASPYFHDLDGNDAGKCGSDLVGNFHEDYDSSYDDQESASELTSQMRGGMSLCDEQDPPVSEEFLAFMQQTIRHKEEWAKKKEALLQQQQRAATAGSALISQQGDEIALQKEHPDVVRSREMKALYGPAAAQLHAMETAVQLAFDRITTRHHARVWPNIPINIMFSDE